MVYVDPAASGTLARILAPLFILVAYPGSRLWAWLMAKRRQRSQASSGGDQTP